MNNVVAGAAPPPVERPIYAGKTSAFYGMYIKMWVLTILTIGVYRFWGKTQVRRYIWSHVSIAKEPFAYLGTGGELFKSSLKFVLLLILPGIILGVISTLLLHGKEKSVEITINTLTGLIMYTFFYAAKYMGLRYRLGRTSWRGIRFELRGSAKAYLVLRIKNVILNILSLGLYRPTGDVHVLRFVLNKAYFGNIAFNYRGQVEELQKTYFLCWLLFLPTFGCSIFWYKAKYIAHVAKYTRLGKIEFRLKIEGWQYLRFAIFNFLLIVFTLGLGYPTVVNRRVKFFARYIKYRGWIDEDAIKQAQEKMGAEGGELSLGFDDFGF